MTARKKSFAQIAITMGDPSGIGAEVTLKACAELTRRSVGVALVVIGDFSVMAEVAQRLNVPLEIREWKAGDAPIPLEDGLGVLSASRLPEKARYPGKPTTEGGAASF